MHVPFLCIVWFLKFISENNFNTVIDDALIEQPSAEGCSPAASMAEEAFDPLSSWGPPLGLPAPLNDGKKRESHGGAGAGAQRSFLSAKTDTTRTSTSSAGKAGTARDLSGGHDGRAQKPAGRSSERAPATAAPGRKPAATDAKKVTEAIYLHYSCLTLSLLNCLTNQF